MPDFKTMKIFVGWLHGQQGDAPGNSLLIRFTVGVVAQADAIVAEKIAAIHGNSLCQKIGQGIRFNLEGWSGMAGKD